MKVIISFIEDNGYPITQYVYPISDIAQTVRVTPVNINSGLGYDTIIVNVPGREPKRIVKKEGWVPEKWIQSVEGQCGNSVKVIYEVEE
jgi:hypothetical protein